MNCQCWLILGAPFLILRKRILVKMEQCQGKISSVFSSIILSKAHLVEKMLINTFSINI